MTTLLARERVCKTMFGKSVLLDFDISFTRRISTNAGGGRSDDGLRRGGARGRCLWLEGGYSCLNDRHGAFTRLVLKSLEQ